MSNFLMTSMGSLAEICIQYNGLTTFINMEMGHKCSESGILYLCKLWDGFFASRIARSPPHPFPYPLKSYPNFISLLILPWPTIAIFVVVVHHGKYPILFMRAHFFHILIRSRSMSRCHMLFWVCINVLFEVTDTPQWSNVWEQQFSWSAWPKKWEAFKPCFSQQLIPVLKTY